MSQDAPLIKEDWNTGAGYYNRLNEILNSAAVYQFQDNIAKWYKCLLLLYKEIHPKITGQEQKTMEDKFNKFVEKVAEPSKDKVPSGVLFSFELYLRGMLEKKGMLTPVASDPGKALM